MSGEKKIGIYEAIGRIMTDVSAISKERKNQQQGFMFRGIDDVYNMVHPLFAKYGVFSVPSIEWERTEERKTRDGGNLIYRVLKMAYTFYASDGSCVQATVVGEGMDTGDKAGNKAMSIAHKYAILQLLCIPTEDSDDPDKTTPPPSVPGEKSEKAPAPATENPVMDGGYFLAKISAAKSLDELNALKEPIKNAKLSAGVLKTLRAMFGTKTKELTK